MIERFSELLEKHGLDRKVMLKGSFCMERCGEGVNWQIDGQQFNSATEADAVAVFCEKVLGPLGLGPADGPGGKA